MNDITVKTVDEWLNAVSYGSDANYVPSDFALEFVAFIKLVNGDTGEENKTPVLHYKMLDQVGSVAVGETSVRIANMIHRGAAKTTLMGEYLFLYLAVYNVIPNFGKVELAIYVSDSIDNGVKNMRKNLEFRWENSEFLQQYIPSIKFTDIRWEFNNIDGGKFIVKAYGGKTGVRGTKEMGKRPKLAVLDDLVSDEDARSQTVISAIKDTVSKAVEYALHPTLSMVIWSGTPFNAGDPLYMAVESGAWKVNVYPVCEQYPCAKEDFKGSWEDRFTYEYVKKQYDKSLLEGRLDAFNQELMLRIMSDEDRLIRTCDIRWFKRDAVIKNKGRFNFYITTDFATSEKQSADDSAISVWAYSNAGDWYWVDGVLKKQTMDKNIDDLFRLAQMYKPMQVGIEVSGQQGGFIPWIQEQMLDKNIYFTLASKGNSNNPGIRPNTNKMQRFNIVVPWFKAGKMYFPTEMKTDPCLATGISQLSLASVGGFKSKHDDFIDTVSMLSALKVWKPSEETIVVQTSEGLWESEDMGDTDYSMSSYIV
jgi:predicted phage terminase large subunit-like protein